LDVLFPWLLAMTFFTQNALEHIWVKCFRRFVPMNTFFIGPEGQKEKSLWSFYAFFAVVASAASGR
jgi:hypothetical protein